MGRESVLKSYNECEEYCEIKDNSNIVGKKTKNLTQYAKLGASAFTPIPDSSPALPAGVYRAFIDNSGQAIISSEILNTDEMIEIKDSATNKIVDEVKKFWEFKDNYKKFNFLFKRGILLHGKAGSGKTSTIYQVSKNMVNSGGIVIIIEDSYDISACLKQIREVEPERPIIVIMEDIDDMSERQLLSVLDGEAQVDNIVYIATTNFIGNLNDRVVNRPSRFDLVIEIGMPCADTRRDFFMKKIGTQFGPNGENLVDLSDGFSMAHLKELIVGCFIQKQPVMDVVSRLCSMGGKNG